MDDRISALGSAPVGRLLWRYSLPAVASMGVSSLYNVIGGMFIGRGVGPLALSGLAVNFPLFNLVMGFCALVGAGGATLCSLELGRGHRAEAARLPAQVAALGLLGSLVVGAPLYLALDPVLRLFGAGDATLPYARDYMLVLLAGLPASFLMVGLNNLMRASGHPGKALLTLMVSVSVNLALAPLFIFVFRWGMRGAALATLLAESAACLWLLRHFCTTSGVVRFGRGAFRPSFRTGATILRLGVPPFLMNACACLVVIVINRQLAAHGGDPAIGAYGVFNTLNTLFFMVVLGMTQGLQPIVGYNHGAGRRERVRRALGLGMAVGLAITASGWAALEFAPRLLAGLFTDDEALLTLAVRAMRMGSLLFFLVGAQVVITACFQFVGMAATASALSLSRQLLFLIPALLLLPRRYGLDGVWYAIPVADALAVLVTAGVWAGCRQSLGFGPTLTAQDGRKEGEERL